MSQLDNLILPLPDQLQLEEIQVKLGHIKLVVSSKNSRPTCPDCGQPSHRPHSHYTRTLDDLAVTSLQMLLIWRTRRYFCDNQTCHRRTFVERLPQLAEPFAHRTARQTQTLTRIGQMMGGRAGARLASLLHLPTSRDTLLRLVRRAAPTTEPKPTVILLGVDDFAFRRGHNYGTILVDLARHRVLDLLPDRTAEGLESYSQQVRVVTRDRSGAYREGVELGAPGAIQMADRWHLWHNLGEVLERLLERRRVWQLKRPSEAKVEAAVVEAADQEERLDRFATPPSSTQVSKRPLTALQQYQLELQQARLARKQDRYHTIHRLYEEGLSERAIARHLKLSRTTVGKYLKTNSPPNIAYRKLASRLDKYKSYLWERWQNGQHNSYRLWLDLQRAGFGGSVDVVRRYVRGWRNGAKGGGTASSVTTGQDSGVELRRAVAAMMHEPREWREGESELVQALTEWDEQLAVAYELTQGFVRILKQRKSDQLESWIRTARHSRVYEFVSFGRGLANDLAAVRAALDLPYSNGQTEGQVNRLKLIKRSMYGRAKFDLLRARVLAA